MKLDYKILWFDDQRDSIKNMIEGISTRIGRLGFTLSVEVHSEIKDSGSFLGQLQRRGDIDLVLMDWNMGSNADNGAILAKKIRNKIYTEIVFYSSAPPSELRKAIYDQDIDGVYCIRRETLVSEVVHVIRTTIKKVLDLNHIRGLVMGAVSEFDAQMEQIISLLADRLGERNDCLGSYIRKAILSANQTSSNEIEELRRSPELANLIEHRAYTAHLKYKTLCAVLDRKSNDRAVVDLHDRLKKYQKEVIEPRNALAHAKADDTNGKVTFKGRDLEFDEERLLRLRLDLLAQGDNLCDIRKAIEAGVFDDLHDL
jgi:DNA-binding NarL/FixJ family response regulator